MIKNYTKALLLFSVLIIILIIGCKRESVLDNPIDPVTPTPTTTVVNDLTQATASVSGIVLDESNAPIASAVVTSGGATTTTNSNGMFIFQNISLSKENGSVTVIKAGYFKGVRSFKTTAGKNHTVRLQLMQKILSGTVNAAAGGTINSNGGASITFPAAAFVTSTGAAYTGTVNVYSRWINPTAANLPFIIPGDLRGVSINGAENILETYGMVGAELEDASGNILKIATGKKATISIPLPASLQASAPATIQLWHFDDATARWIENGTATKAGTTYTAQVDKFSFWNVDVGTTNFINLDYTLINATTNTPLVSTSTRIKRANGTYGYGITNNAGFVSGLVPKNEALILEVVVNTGCNIVVFSQNIGPFAANTSLGNVSATLTALQYITFTGTLLNCSATAVTNGYVSISAIGGYGGFGNTSPTGAFSFSILNCTGTSIASYNYQGTDNATAQQSALLSGTAATALVNLGTITACGTATLADIYVAGVEGTAKVWKNGVPLNLSNAMDSSIANSVFVSGSDVYVAGSERGFGKVWKNGVVTNLVNSSNKSYTTSIFVSGNDVYVAGGEFVTLTNSYSPKFWKNGISTTLINNSTDAFASSIFVVGGDVYVTGKEYNLAINNYKAKLWKNGVAINLIEPVSNIGSEANSVVVSGSDVYVAGLTVEPVFGGGVSSIGRGTVWLNGVPTYLPNSNESLANSIFISGNDVYITGYSDVGYVKHAKLWKNGVEINSMSGYVANSIFVKGNDTYVAGIVPNNNGLSQNAIVWKNGLATNFFNPTNNITHANSIFVK